MKQKIICLLLLAFNFSVITFAQTGFYTTEPFISGGRSVQKANDGNLIIGLTAYSNFTLILEKWTPAGEVLWSTDYAIFFTSSPGNYTVLPVPGEGYYVIFGNIIAKFSEDGDLIFKNEYGETDLGYSDGTYISAVTFNKTVYDGTNLRLYSRMNTSTDNFEYLITTADLSGNILSSNSHAAPEDNYIDFYFSYHDGYDYINYTYQDVVEDIDKSVFEKRNAASGLLAYTDTQNDINVLELLLTNDGIIQRYRKPSYPTDVLTEGIQKRNFAGDTLWNKVYEIDLSDTAEYHSEGINRMIQLQSGNILALSQCSVGISGTSGVFYHMGLIYFSPDGDTLSVIKEFTSIFVGPGYGVMDMHQVGDNLLAFTGGDYSGGTHAWVMVTDTLGNYYNYYVSGQLYQDANTNGIYDAGEVAFSDVLVKSEPINYYAYTDEEGKYTMRLGAEGDITISPVPVEYWDIVEPVSYTVAFDTSMNEDTITGYDFLYDYTTVVKDISASVYQCVIVPGLENYNSITITNNGNQFDANGTVTLQYPSVLTDATAVPDPDTHVDTIFTWNYTDLDPYESQTYTANYITSTAFGITGDTVLTIGNVSAAGDTYTSNNTDSVYTEIVSSFDPNHKLVSPAGTGTEGYIDISTQYLTYTIEFQNTGTAATHFVNIYDTLNYALNIETIEMISASHNYDLEITAPDVLHWKFDPLFLPDSASDMLGSMGYLKFRIKIKDGAIENDVIENTAAIYFDYNPVIYTNTVRNTLTDLTTVTDIPSALKLQLYPNPVSKYLTIDFTITQNENDLLVISDIRGRKIMTQNIAANINSATIDISSLPAGVYICTLFSDQKILAAEKFDVIK